jgi:hypothetical protein
MRKFTLLLASPSDVSMERDVISQWIEVINESLARESKTEITVLRWERDAVPDVGERAQDVINRQLVDRADIIMAIFWTRFGTSTGRFASGTEEEIHRAIRVGKRVLLYFSGRKIDPRTVDMDQLAKTEAFRKGFPGLYGVFNEIDELKGMIELHLKSVIQSFLLGTPWSMGASRYDPDFFRYVTSVDHIVSCRYKILNVGGDTEIVRQDSLKVTREAVIDRTSNISVYAPAGWAFEPPIASVIIRPKRTKLTPIMMEPNLRVVGGENWYHYSWRYRIAPPLALGDELVFESTVMSPGMNSDALDSDGALFHVSQMTANIVESRIAILCEIDKYKLRIDEQFSQTERGRKIQPRSEMALLAPDGKMISWILKRDERRLTHCIRFRVIAE